MNNDHANFRDENNIQTTLTIENEKIFQKRKALQIILIKNNIPNTPFDRKKMNEMKRIVLKYSS